MVRFETCSAPRLLANSLLELIHVVFQSEIIDEGCLASYGITVKVKSTLR